MAFFVENLVFLSKTLFRYTISELVIFPHQNIFFILHHGKD